MPLIVQFLDSLPKARAFSGSQHEVSPTGVLAWPPLCILLRRIISPRS